MKLLLVILSIFCFLHIVRDVLQIKGIKNWFTEFGHVWNKPEWEKYSIAFFLILGVIFFILATS